MARVEAHRWAFASRFRRHAFGWKSQPAIQRVRQAVSEIKKVARLAGLVEMAWSPARERRGCFHGTTARFSALLRAGRYEAILVLLEKAPFFSWTDRQWGARALAAPGRTDEAIQCAEASRGLNDCHRPVVTAGRPVRTCDSNDGRSRREPLGCA
jgi:hypothetical protein